MLCQSLKLYFAKAILVSIGKDKALVERIGKLSERTADARSVIFLFLYQP